LEHFGGPCNGKCWYNVWYFYCFGMFYQEKSGNPGKVCNSSKIHIVMLVIHRKASISS
jgi:hypothetical protein